MHLAGGVNFAILPPTPTCLVVENPRRAPSRHCRDAGGSYGHTATAMHDMMHTPPSPPNCGHGQYLVVRNAATPHSDQIDHDLDNVGQIR